MAATITWVGKGKVMTANTLTAAWIGVSSMSANTTNFVEGTQSLSEKVSNTTAQGYTVNTTDIIGEPFNFASGGNEFGEHIFAWITAYESPDTLALGGFGIVIADDLATDSYAVWYVGPQEGYLGGWASYVVNPANNFDAVIVPGSATWTVGGNPAQLSGVDGFGARWKITKSITGNVDNCFVDTIAVGYGYKSVGSTGVFADFTTFEQATTTGRYGGLRTISGLLLPRCKIYIGESSGAGNTVFTDSGFTVVWAKATQSDGSSSAVASDFYELKFQKGSGTTDVTLSSGSLSAVSPHTVVLNFAGTTSANLDAVNVDRAGAITLDSAVSWTNSTIKNSGQISTTSAATLTGTTVSGYTGATNTAALYWNVAADASGKLDNMSFTKGAGSVHAIRFGAYVASITLTGITFSGYNASNDTDDATLLFSDTGSDQTWTVNLSGTTGNVSYRKLRAGDTVNIVSSISLTIRIVNEAGALITDACEVTVIEQGVEGTALYGPVEVTDGDTVYSYAAGLAGTNVNILVYNAASWLPSTPPYTLAATNATTNVQLSPDRAYSNP